MTESGDTVKSLSFHSPQLHDLTSLVEPPSHDKSDIFAKKTPLLSWANLCMNPVSFASDFHEVEKLVLHAEKIVLGLTSEPVCV